LTSLFIAIFSASGAVAEEIENKTITTVTSYIHNCEILRCRRRGVPGTLYLHYCPVNGHSTRCS
jgi:hypothetical protein